MMTDEPLREDQLHALYHQHRVYGEWVSGLKIGTSEKQRLLNLYQRVFIQSLFALGVTRSELKYAGAAQDSLVVAEIKH